MSLRITAKGKVIESPLPIINKKTLKIMKAKVVKPNPLLRGIKAKKLSIKVI